MDHSPRFLKLVEQAKKKVHEVTVDFVMQRLAHGQKFHLIDVREDHEWAGGHIKGARHLGRGVLEREIEREIPDTDAEIILYCGGGYRSALSAEALEQMGYTRVSSMDGGWRGWTAAQGPIEKTS
jgi:rhodanese-related sulfurtransferase